MAAESQIRKVRIFLASPGDTQSAREEVVQIVDRINADPAYNRHIQMELLRWDDPQRSVPFSWLRNPQNEVVDYTGDPAGTHLLVAIFRHTFGSYLPVDEFGTSPDGDPWTGTEWEIAQAVDAASGGRHNEVWIYHDQADFVLSNYQDEKSRNEAYAQYNRVSNFIGEARSPQGVIQRGYETYTDTIAGVFDSRLREWLTKHFIDKIPERPEVNEADQDSNRNILSAPELDSAPAKEPKNETNNVTVTEIDIDMDIAVANKTPESNPSSGLSHESTAINENLNENKIALMPSLLILSLTLMLGYVYFGPTQISNGSSNGSSNVSSVAINDSTLRSSSSSNVSGTQTNPTNNEASSEKAGNTSQQESVKKILDKILPVRSQCVISAAEITAKISKDKDSLARIREEIFEREGAGKRDNLIAWNEGEEFPSLGIGHFIWYPENYKGPFTESFPMVIRYLVKLGHSVPVEFYKNNSVGFPPWYNAEELKLNRGLPRFQELLDFLDETGSDQARFAIDRFSGALSSIICDPDGTVNTVVESNAARVGASAAGLRHLMDYALFKGEGTNPSERYGGYGWGLRQVLEKMDGYVPDALAAFRQAAVFVLQRRVENAPVARNESRWMAGWEQRIKTYR